MENHREKPHILEGIEVGQQPYNDLSRKGRYHIRNWKQYNQSLVNRGSITFWSCIKLKF